MSEQMCRLGTYQWVKDIKKERKRSIDAVILRTKRKLYSYEMKLLPTPKKFSFF